MADSIKGFVPIPELTDREYSACNFPYDANRREQIRKAGRQLRQPGQHWFDVKSITGATFKVRGEWQQHRDGSKDRERLAGYWVSINASCSVGNNVLLTNGVPRACQLAVLHLQRWALQQGCSWEGAKLLDYERMRLTEVTPTFLHRMGSRQEAVDLSRDVRLAMELYNKPPRAGTRSLPAGFGVGPSYEATAYLRQREIDLGGYVKDRCTDTSHVFESDEIMAAVHDEGDFWYRLEALLKGAFLRAHGLEYPEAWRLYGGQGPYPMVYAHVRKMLQLDRDLRRDEPSLEEMTAAKVSASDQEVVLWHLAGRSAADHPLVVGDRTHIAQLKYLSDVKARVLQRLRIDVSIPWERQKAAPLAKLRGILQYPGLYCPPAPLGPHSYGPASTARVVHRLQQEIVSLAPGRFGSLALDYLDAEPAPIRLGALTVEDAARRTLDKHKVPLHALLRSHELGCFGDVDPSEALAQQSAMLAGNTATSKFRVFDRTILVTTDQRSGTTAVNRL